MTRSLTKLSSDITDLVNEMQFVEVRIDGFPTKIVQTENPYTIGILQAIANELLTISNQQSS